MKCEEDEQEGEPIRGYGMGIASGGTHQFRIFGTENVGQLEEPHPLKEYRVHDLGGDKGSLPDRAHLP